MFDEAQSDPSLPEDAYDAHEARLRVALLKAQYRLLERSDRALLLVVAGIDGAGKGATINLLNEWMDPRHIQTMAFGPPESDELERPPLWRYWNELPAKGRTGIVFGSWYVPLLREAARKRPRQHRIEAHADSIRRFEAVLAADGVQIVKLWYHLSAQAQAQRMQRLLARPETAWQVTAADHKVRKKYPRLCHAGQQAIVLTDAPHAPWTIIPSADDNLRAIRTSETVLAALQQRSAPRVAAHSAQPLAPAQRRPSPLASIDYDARLDKDEYESALARLQGRLAQSVRSRGFRRRSLVLVFEGQDAAGKGGAIRRVTRALDARQFDLAQISAPAAHEQARPYLWRFWRRLPRCGRIAIFDRSWYGRVLVERVERLAKPADWQRAYAEINDFEQQLTDHGAIVVKFWLAITPEVQLQRFRDRQQSPFKHFKITAEDWRNREKWQASTQAADAMLTRTDTPCAPWHVVPSNDKRHARIQVLQHIVDALETSL